MQDNRPDYILAKKSGRPNFPEFQPVTILAFKIMFSMSFSANREEIYFIDANRMQNQEYEYTHHRSVRSICWNPCTDFIIVDKFGTFSVILDKENSKIFRGSLPPHPPRKRSYRGSSCLWRSLGQNGENVLISDFQMLAKYEIIECIKFVADMQQADNLASLKF